MDENEELEDGLFEVERILDVKVIDEEIRYLVRFHYCYYYCLNCCLNVLE